MNRQWLDGMWDHTRKKYGIYLRALDAIPADRFHTPPIEGMRSPSQLVVHTSGSIVRDIAEGVASGTIGADEGSESEVAASLADKAAVMAYARDCWNRADAAIAKVGDAQLEGPVANPWGMALNGTFAMVILGDEFMHHRGQLFAYVRACGAEPPFMWGFDANEPEFRPAD